MIRWGGLLLLALLAGCSCGVDRGSDGSGGGSTARLCEIIAVPVDAMEAKGLSVEEALTEPGKTGIGVRAGFAFMRADEESGAERFRPALRYLSSRWNAESWEGEKDPAPPSAAVVANARELDRFLADGGCG